MKSNIYIIENDYLKKTFNLKGDKIASWQLYNKKSNKTIDALEGSEEFIVCFKNSLFGSSTVRSSELKIESTDERDSATCKTFVISFKGVRIKDSKLKIALVYEAMKHQGLFRKFIEIRFEKTGTKPLILDYIDLEAMRFDGKLRCWSIPDQKNSHVPGYGLEMGQPLYVDSVFMGCEFPAALNKISDFTTSIRCYSGKDLKSIFQGKVYHSYNAVIGSADGNVFEQVQRAFFDYIKTISKPVSLRRQYNSWYDHMLNITRENVYGSFLEIEKALTKTGEKPLDSYVADDGWNDYSKGFWGFNDKFPDELYPFSVLAESFGSKFGLWIGPRGGYNPETIKFAKHIQREGNGYVNNQSFDICVASDKYLTRLTELMLSYQEKYNLNYWKIDGFAKNPCKSRHHGHMTGGHRNMYYYTDLWEKWIILFNKLYENGGSDFWLNNTSYLPPSPWFLQYSNSVWMQISDDMGFEGKKGVCSDKDRLLSYRDERYFDFYKDRQFQFPQAYLYNHDPVYGNEAKVNMSDEEFREYLFTMAMRGTAFWELYYSYNMMNEEKWRINYSVLRFIEDNLDILSNSIIFGGRPSKGQVYGFSCFDKYEGIIALRNSSDKAQEYMLHLDETIGVSKELLFAQLTQVLPYMGYSTSEAYSYGETIKVSLKPYQTKILHFGRRVKDMQAVYVDVVDSNTLEVTFNQFIGNCRVECAANPVAKTELLGDYMTLRITFCSPFDRLNTLTLGGLSDIMGNKSDVTLSFDYYKDYMVTEGLYGKGAFTVKAMLDGEEPHMLMRQGEEISLYVGDDAKVHFRMGYSHIISRSSVHDKVQVVVVREKTGVIKLYLDGEPDSGMYCNLVELSGMKAAVYNEGKVKLYNKAFSYDEI